MALRDAILVSLSDGPMSGYDLAKHFDQTVGFFWRATHSQIYRELSKLKDKGLVTAEEISQSGKPNRILYSITEADTGKFIGVGSLHEVAGHDAPHMGYWIGEPFWGKGYATEAARALVDLYFKATTQQTLLVSARVSNEASIKIIRKCGGKHIGTSTAVHPLLGETQRLDEFQITRESWMGEIAA